VCVCVKYKLKRQKSFFKQNTEAHS
jgi:hypothetical protein